MEERDQAECHQAAPACSHAWNRESYWTCQLWDAVNLLLFGLSQVQFEVSFPDDGKILTNRLGQSSGKEELGTGQFYNKGFLDMGNIQL